MTVRIVLGTAQFGLDYGVMSDCRPAEAEIRRILERAAELGIATLDTAAAYGNAESIIGHLTADMVDSKFEVVSKLAPMGDAPIGVLEDRLAESLQRLRRRALEALLFHRSSDLTGPLGADRWKLASGWRETGVVRKLGVSLYDPDELHALLAGDIRPDIIQIPANILDTRWFDGVLDEARTTLGTLEIHVRSLFLQGVLLASPDSLPAFLQPLVSSLEKLQHSCDELGASMLEMLFAFAESIEIIDAVVLGVDNLTQLEEIAVARDAAGRYPFDLHAFRHEDLQMVDPRNWPQ